MARLDVLSNRIHILDLECEAGIAINHQPVEHGFLLPGDTAQLGEFEIAIYSDAYSPDDHAQTLDLEGPAHLAMPPRIGGYELIEPLGEGGMGQVFLARNQQQNEQVAIKLLRDVPGLDSEVPLERMFAREAQLLRKLNHPKIVRYLDHGREQDLDYLVLEYIDVEPFLPRLEKQKPAQRIRLAVGIGCQMLEALEYAHRQSIVHRDVKPENVLAYKSKESGKLTAKLSDFGLSKNFVDEQSIALTAEGQVGGTLKFIAPEQFLDYRNAEPRSDLYAMAATIYYWLSGVSPHTDEHGQLFPVQALPDCDAIPLQKRNTSIPSELQERIHRGLQNDPKRRFVSADHMRQELLPFTNKDVLNRLMPEPNTT